MDAVRNPAFGSAPEVHFHELSRDSVMKFKEEGMRIFVTWLLAFGMIVSPTMAGTDGAGDAKNTTASTTTNTTNTTTAAEKGKTGDSAATASKTEAAKPAASSVEGELQQLRDLIEAQTKLLQSQSEQLKEQQQRMQVLESEVNSSSTRDGFVATSDSVDPDSHTAGVASPPVDGIPTGRAAGSPQLGNESPVAIHFKGITITPGGFLAAETVFRNKATAADINTPLNSIPFSGSSGAQTTEWNSSARQSRLSLLAEGKLTNVKLSGYVETDFLGAGISSNDNESNSYVLRLRQGWGQAKFDSGFSITGGQMWSLVTETKKAVDNRTEALPLTIDPQYNVGFSWARQEALRVAQTFADGKLTLAASVEESNETLTVHGNPTVTTLGTAAGNQSDVTTTILTTTTFNNFLVGAPGTSGGLYNPTGTYAYNKTPDFVFKAALDPGWGHYEVFGVVGTFRDRVYPCFYANGGFTFPGSLPWTPSPTLTSPVPATPCTL